MPLNQLRVRTPSMPWTPTQGRHPTLIHPGPPEMSIRLMLARPQRSTKASHTAPHHPLPSLQQAQVGVGMGWGLCPFGKKQTNPA